MQQQRSLDSSPMYMAGMGCKLAAAASASRVSTHIASHAPLNCDFR